MTTRIIAGVAALGIAGFYFLGIWEEHRMHGDGAAAAVQGLSGTILFGSIMGCRAVTGWSLLTYLRLRIRRDSHR
jgi:hypothetical protein